MSSELPVIEAHALSKVYQLFLSPADRLRQMLWGAAKGGNRAFSALNGVSFSLQRGEVLGLVGRNGAGKSTLLQIVCGTLQPSAGTLQVRGRVAALLELGAGFNADFSGRENVYLYGSVLGLTRPEIDERFEEIVAFSGIGDFIDQPVKTYSSGMYVRLAFAIATSVDPDILVVDEALSVGDGEFARKSFDRIMRLRDRGTTILFCSHSLFQIESICTRAIWLHGGKVIAEGPPAQVVSAYQEFLDGAESAQPAQVVVAAPVAAPRGYSRFQQIRVGGLLPAAGPLLIKSRQDDLRVQAAFVSDPALPCPSLAVTLHTPDGRMVSSAGAWHDGFVLERDASGRGSVELRFPHLPLLKGRYYVSVYLFCERGLHIYDAAERVMYFLVEQEGLEQGVVHLPHVWSTAMQVNDAVAGAAAPQPQPEDMLDWMDANVRPLAQGQTVQSPHENEPGWPALAERFGLSRNPDGGWIRTRVPRWSLGWIRSDRPSAEWFALFERCFGHAMPESLWRWKHDSHALAGVGVYNQQGSLVGFYGALPRQVIWRGQVAMTLQIADVMVDPAERGVLTRQGPFFLSCVTLLERLMGFGMPFLLGFGFPSRKHLLIAEKLGIYKSVDQMAEVSWASRKMRPSWQIRSRPIDVTDEADVNACWAQMASAMRSSVLGVRNWNFLVRRYLQHPTLTYVVLMVRNRWTHQALGLVVLCERGEEGLELVDLIGAPRHFTLLVRAGLRFAYLSGHHRLFGWVTASHQHLLDVHQARFTPMDIWIPANVWTNGPSAVDLQGQWWLMAGDSDFR